MKGSRHERLRVSVGPVAGIFVALVVSACSEKSSTDREKDASETPRELVGDSRAEKNESGKELQPPEDKIGQDCVAFVRLTKVVPARGASADCPGCPVGGTEVLSFRHMKTDAVTCSGDTCTVAVTLHAVFNPGAGETIAGGLTAWIPPEQRTAYLSGQIPTGEHAFRVRITYKRRGAAWRAVEFDRAPAE